MYLYFLFYTTMSECTIFYGPTVPEINYSILFYSILFITKVFLLCDTNSSKMGKKLCVQCRKKIMQMPVEMPVEQNISSTSEELKSNDTTSVVASGTGTPDRVFFGLLNRLHMLCHCFSER